MKTGHCGLLQTLTLAAFAFSATSRCVLADLQIYTLSGIGIGYLGDQFFFQAPFTITAAADTGQIVDLGPTFPDYPADGHVFSVAALPGASVFVSGLGSGSFIDPASIFTVQDIYTSSGFWGISGLNQSGDPEDIVNMTVDDRTFGNIVSTYDLSTPIGPGHGLDGNGGTGSGPFLTSAGAFHLISWSTAVFQASPVPEPASIVLLLVGAATAWYRGKR